MRLSDELTSRAQTLIGRRLGLDLPWQREADLQEALERCFESLPFREPEACLAWLAAAPESSSAWSEIAGRLSVGETYFFRDGEYVAALKSRILPSLIAARRSEGVLRLKLWSAGCATGEEPYSLAILLDELLHDYSAWSVTILATDFNTRALEAARRGIYREWSLRATPGAIRERHFRRRRDCTYEIDPRIRGMVTFERLNLTADGFPSIESGTCDMDLILCRNVLMYLTREALQGAVSRLARALREGGWLIVSPVEAAAERFSPLATVVYPDVSVFRKVRADSPGAPDPWVPAAGAIDPAHGSDIAEVPGNLIEPPPSETASRLDPGPALLAARSLAGMRRLDEAQRICEVVLGADRLNLQAYLLLAAISQERGSTEAAVESLKRAIYLQPDSAAAHFLLGNLLLRRGQENRGRRHMRSVVSLLGDVAPGSVVPDGEGLTAGRLLETARMHVESS